ncbi:MULTISPECIES: DUF460 domain-containing protein [Archaeoglobus]|uniref:DUF460 domain-containing protein n=4 Tax=Archaeoglobus fulgidus TaxID=2234 RepID=O30244_ARCFU|nr:MULTISPECIES: DUF460 domain-containing protein [Archaeoglobus]AAB91237.1 predicted coding region AF_2427 [Archaeoglobus fulgidus DSM 4304]AIG99394.1 hypothetical protein AFULGI_00026920 [Archaeoglobus fulgidus DSM 8774]KUJ94795.1 MAG: hypothetical protein XD40_0116 [Archaeoglobus fulgidus]KUK06117.1 MAG: hypothetical protein XD48_1651 [Archaeoglobus fulgidus]MDI3498379.1 uncharacterized protein [Archaeoglobus sp.]
MSVVFGVDIVGGSVHGKIKPKYAVVVLENGNEFEKIVSRSKLFRMVKKEKPDIIAVDNIYEVFKDKKDLIFFLKNAPSKTKLVQVTDRENSLPSLSKRFGLNINIRNPVDEARACAYLASFGMGSEISVFTDKTKITVSRNRSLGKGGWRQKKYGRKIHNAVREVYKEIRDRIVEAGFEFVEEVRKGYGGISRGVILVSAPRDRVPINSFKTRDVQVAVEAVEKEKIEFIPLRRTLRYLIVGIDPGATTAIAALDLRGELVDMKSRKGWSPAEVIEFISSLGKPVVVSTDKSSPPEFVSKIRASFNAVLYTPKEDMSVEKKRILTSKYSTSNDHERDALAAAIDAFNSYKSKLINVEKRLPAGIDSDRIKAEIIRGTPLKEVLSVTREESREEKVQAETVSREEILKRDRVIERLKEENRILSRKIKEMKDEIEKLRARVASISREEHEKIRKDTYVQNLEREIFDLRKKLKEKDEEIEQLKERIALLRKMKMLEFQGWKEVKVLRKFTKEEIERAEREMGISEGDIILIVDSSGGSASLAEMLCEKKVRAIIYGSEMSHLAAETFEKYNIPRISIDEVEIMMGDDIAVVNAEEFERVYAEKLEETKRRKIDFLEKLVEDYRRRRVV